MSLKMKRIGGVSLIIVLSFSALFIFQNCADPLEFGGQDSLGSGENLPFAFEEKLDTISYMSCSDIDITTFQSRAIYTFRVGAYKETSGIRLSEAFFNATNNLADSERASALYSSAINRGATMQLSIRKAEGYQDILVNSSGAVREGFDYANFLAPLDTSGIATRLAVTKDGAYSSYFAGTPGLGTRFIEQSIRFIEEEARSTQVRNHLMGSAGVDRESRLTVTYTAGLDQPYFARAPVEGSNKAVYGTGFQIGFRTPYGFTSAPPRALRNIEEFNLLDGRKKPEAVWNCGQDGYVFTIVRPGDVVSSPTANANLKHCATIVDSGQTLNADQRKRLELIRRVLRAEDWFVDPVQNCVVPKTVSAACYGTANGAVPAINYTSACSVANKNCPHLVSVCERID